MAEARLRHPIQLARKWEFDNLTDNSGGIMTDRILSLQELPPLNALDLGPLGLSDDVSAESCSLCTHTCCCTAAEQAG